MFPPVLAAASILATTDLVPHALFLLTARLAMVVRGIFPQKALRRYLFDVWPATMSEKNISDMIS